MQGNTKGNAKTVQEAPPHTHTHHKKLDPRDHSYYKEQAVIYTAGEHHGCTRTTNKFKGQVSQKVVLKKEDTNDNYKKC